MNSIKRIVNVLDNNIFSEDVIQNNLISAMLLNYANPVVACLYIVGNKTANDEKIKALASKVNLEYRDGKLYIKGKEEVIDKNYVISSISNNVGDAITACENNSDYDYDLMRLEVGKDVLNDAMSKVDKKEVHVETIIAIDDLRARLFADTTKGAMKR